MKALENQSVLVIGLGVSGRAACRLLRRHGAVVTAVDRADSEVLRDEARLLRTEGVEVRLGAGDLPERAFQLAVLSPGVPSRVDWVQEMTRRGVPVVGELELGFRYTRCPCVAITGTNGKTTTTELVERFLNQAGGPSMAAGNIGRPLCDVADRSAELAFVAIEASSFQLETIRSFHPVVAVLLNVTPDHLDRYPGMPDYIRAKARLFMNQQPADWAIIQHEAMVQLRALGLSVPARVITFSARDCQADLHLDNDRVVSRLPGLSGTLFDLTRGLLRGPHNAENLMAALGGGFALGFSMTAVADALKSYRPAPHRCERVAEACGIQFINDSKATNVDAVRQALLTVPARADGKPNVWLIAGGKDKGFDFGELGPLLAARVKGAFLLGETRERIRAAWMPFTPCTPVNSLLEAVTEAGRQAVCGDVILLSPACSSFDMFRDYQHRGEMFRQAAQEWLRQRTCEAEMNRVVSC
ncbi:MAG: UDP-N-acetylmuramoyl-L-alanine--D-glutamate ligase [Candidatus Omnitrophica bacterium]|nr:UDP-N-acetylmuramoyl-L-alanine--D-glutamate ligase [Candidatus Omnitrophota bacterium]